MEKSVFQKIIDREIPATIEHEDDDLIVIHDIQPNAKLHLLIIPKKPIRSINEATEADAELIGKDPPRCRCDGQKTWRK